MILKKKLSKIISIGLLTFVITLNSMASLVYADGTDNISRLNSLREKIENDIEKNGVPNDNDMAELEKIMNLIENNGGEPIRTGNNTWIDLGKGYKMRLDTPESTGNPKYHVHVYHNDNEIASENADGTKSHKKSIDDIPSKKIREKIKSNSKWKDFKKKQSKLSKAVTQVKGKYTKAQLKKSQYVKLAKALVIGTLGFALFSSMGSWVAFFAVI